MRRRGSPALVLASLLLGAGCGAAPLLDTRGPTLAASEPPVAVSWVVMDDPLAIAPEAPVPHGAPRELVPQWGHTAEVRELRWLSSGPIAVLDDLGHLALLEPSSGERLLWERPTDTGLWEEPFELDRSGRYLRTGDGIHDLRTGDERLLPITLPEGVVAAAAPDLSAVAWAGRSGDGAGRLAVAQLDGTLRVEVELDLGTVHAIAWSPTARTLLVADARALELRSATDGALLRRIESGEEVAADGLVGAFRPTGGALAVLSGGDLSLLDPRDGTELGRVPSVAPPRTWAELRWSADGGRLAVARRDDEDAIVIVFDAHDGSRVSEVRVAFGLPSEVALSPDARLLAVGTSDGRIHVFEAEGGAEVVLIDSGRRASSPPFAFDPRGRFLALAGDEAIDVWDLELREEIGGFYQPGAERHLWAMRGLSDGVGVLTADEDASYLWTTTAFHMDEACPSGGSVRVDDAGVVRVIGGVAVCDLTHGITVRPGWWIRTSSPDGHVVVNAQGGLFVEDAVTGERRATLTLDEGERPPCSTSSCGLPVALSDGGALVAVARRTLLRVFDGRTGAVRARTDVGGRTQTLRFAPGNRTLVFMRDDGQLVIFDAATLARRLERATSGPVAEGFSDDGRVHVHATRTTLTLLGLRGGRGTPTDVTLADEAVPREIVFFASGDRFALVRSREERADDGSGDATVATRTFVDVRALPGGGLLGTFEADTAGVARGGTTLVGCTARVLTVAAIAGDGSVDAATARPLGVCSPGAEIDVTDDGRFAYVNDDEGLHVVRTADGARLSLHLVDAGWDVTAAIVRDDASRWDDGGYFERPFLLRGEGEITSASLDDARSSFVAGLARYFERGEAPPIDEAAQPASAP